MGIDYHCVICIGKWLDVDYPQYERFWANQQNQISESIWCPVTPWLIDCGFFNTPKHLIYWWQVRSEGFGRGIGATCKRKPSRGVRRSGIHIPIKKVMKIKILCFSLALFLLSCTGYPELHFTNVEEGKRVLLGESLDLTIEGLPKNIDSIQFYIDNGIFETRNGEAALTLNSSKLKMGQHTPICTCFRWYR